MFLMLTGALGVHINAPQIALGVEHNHNQRGQRRNGQRRQCVVVISGRRVQGKRVDANKCKTHFRRPNTLESDTKFIRRGERQKRMRHVRARQTK